jgi:succinylglutamate desuccinylase
MTEKATQELIWQLLRICVRLEEASKGWCVTYETPEKTRRWVGKLHLEAESCSIRLGDIINSIGDKTK